MNLSIGIKSVLRTIKGRAPLKQPFISTLNPARKVRMLHNAKQPSQSTLDSAFDRKLSFFVESIERYAAGAHTKLTVSGNDDWCCEMTLHGIKLSIFMEDPFIGLQADIPQWTPLSKYAVAKLEAEIVHVETNHPGQASLTHYLRSDFMFDDKEFHSRISNFVSMAKRVTESQQTNR